MCRGSSLRNTTYRQAATLGCISLSISHDRHLALNVLIFTSVLKNAFSYLNLLCLVTTEQDQELDELSASVEKLAGVGLTTHEELMGQVNFLGHI